MNYRRLLSVLLVLFALLVSTGCSTQAQNSSANPAHAPLELGKRARILALGDSITRGSGDGYGNYRRPLQSLLAGAGYSFEFVGSNTEQSDNYHGADPEQTFSPYQKGHEGYGGFRIDQIGSYLPDKDDGGVTYPGLTNVLQQSAPDVVLMMLGTNDVTQGYDKGGAAYAGVSGFAGHAAGRLNALVGQIFLARPSATLVLATITPLREADRQQKVAAYNALVKRIVAARQQKGEEIVLADMSAALDSADLAGDGVHPTTRGYDKMARVWFAALTGKPAPPLAAPTSAMQGQLAQLNLFSPTQTVTASNAFDNPALGANHLIDGTSKAFVWGKSDDEKVSVSGFQSAIGRLRFFNTPSYTGRTPHHVTIYASSTRENSLDPKQYTKIGAFDLPVKGDAFGTLTMPPVNPDQSEPAVRVQSVISYCDLDGLKIPAGTQSLLLDFSKSGGDGDGLSEIQAFAPKQK